MKTIPGFLIILFMTMNISGQEALNNRKAAVAGSFYPAGEKELKRTLQELFDEAADQEKPVLKNNENVRALVSPHAGYVFSGAVAASAIACIPPDAQFENIFLIGSSHRVSFPGASVYTEGDYETPLGLARVDRETANQLVSNSKTFSYHKEAHATEHSLEVQIPFLQYHLKNEISIIPIIIGTHNTKVCREIAGELKPYFNSKNLFIISSDFSHYPPFDEAVKLDKKTAEAYLSGDPGTFLATIRDNSRSGIRGLATSMCGWTSGLVLLHLCQEDNDLDFKHIMYRNSGHSKFGDASGVVGYNSIVITGVENEKEDSDFSISHSGRETLLRIARQSIGSVLGKNKKPVLKDPEMPDDIRARLGAFVTL
ncbi:MAG TPA: AmmeMemoRadiSam system protein B, partial [Bacteroidales bacterium]|nr:AmmeMemoRadiSam system protein B [Bacteroidales bacterium]